MKSTLAAAGELHLDALVDELRQVECSFLAPSLAMKQAAPLNLASRATTNVDKQTVSARGKGHRRFTISTRNPSRRSCCLRLRTENRRETRTDFRPNSRCGRRSSAGTERWKWEKLAEKQSRSLVALSVHS